MTGEDEPEVGSTAVAIANPDEDAIFSPARDAAPKIIVRIKPADKPIIISVTPITTPLNEVIVSMLGNVGLSETTMMVSPILIIILTGRITNVAPKSGDAKRKAPILRLAKKN